MAMCDEWVMGMDGGIYGGAVRWKCMGKDGENGLWDG